MVDLKTTMDSTMLTTTIGLEIHVQLKTKSKMFCGCDNDAQGKAPNTVVCPVCLGLPGSLPVANKQAVLLTLKTGFALNCKINKISKFDRKHYFYPDLPKGYQISQYDEPLCGLGFLEIDGHKIRINRIHLEEDAGKLIHSGDKSSVDLNRAGTPLMEIVTEPDIISAKEAGEFLRKLQKIVRDEVQVSEASMEKGHMRCDANISITDGKSMSQIIEIKNLNSFKFVEKALTLADENLRNEYGSWPENTSKETWGYDSVNNKVYLQRRKEEAADYRYFPEPDLPPIDSSEFDLESLRNEIQESGVDVINKLIVNDKLSGNYAKILAESKNKFKAYKTIVKYVSIDQRNLVARVITQNDFGFDLDEEDINSRAEYYAIAIVGSAQSGISKQALRDIAVKIHNGQMSESAVRIATNPLNNTSEIIEIKIEDIITKNPAEFNRYKAGEKQLFGFFMGQVMAQLKGQGNPTQVNKILREKLEG
jgi:aspartyl-tRNA(Asn)/glutamyl-tRNA(Gln) amidotransferase subunit B